MATTQNNERTMMDDAAATASGPHAQTYGRPNVPSGMYASARAAGVPAPHSLAHASSDDRVTGDNQYMLSLFEPWTTTTKLPDLDMTMAIAKQVSAPTSVTVAGSGELMFVVNFHQKDPNQAIRIYAFDTVTSTYNFLQSLPWDVDLAQYYRSLRFVSGGVSVQSSTFTGSAFTVQGTINSAAVHDLPDLETLRHAQIPSYKRDAGNALGSVPLSEGTVALACPNGNHQYHTPHTASVYSGAEPWVVTEAQIPPDPTIGGGVWTLNRANGGIPKNTFGHLSVGGYLSLQIAASGPGTLRLKVDVTTRGANPSTYAQVLTTTSCDVYARYEGGWLTIPINFHMYRQEEYHEIFVETTDTSGLITSYLAQQFCCSATFFNVNPSGANGPAALVGVKNASVGQQIAVNAVGNYEVVPDADLSQNVGTSFDRLQTLDLEVAETLLSRPDVTGLHWVYPLGEYTALRNSGMFRHISNREVMIARASGISDFFKGVWHGIKKVIGVAAPVVGASFGPEGAVVGNLVSKLAMSSGPIAHCSGPDPVEEELTAVAPDPFVPVHTRDQCSGLACCAGMGVEEEVKAFEPLTLPDTPDYKETTLDVVLPPIMEDICPEVVELRYEPSHPAGTTLRMEYRSACPDISVHRVDAYMGPGLEAVATKAFKGLAYCSGLGEAAPVPVEEDEVGSEFRTSLPEVRTPGLGGPNSDWHTAAKMELIKSGNMQKMREVLNSGEQLQGKASFPTTTPEGLASETPGILVVSTGRHMGREYHAPVLLSTGRGDVDVYIDKIYNDPSGLVNRSKATLGECLLLQLTKSPTLVVSIDPPAFGGTKALGLTGPSADAALFAASNLFPNLMPITGSQSTPVNKTPAKLEASLKFQRRPLIVVNPVPEEVPVLSTTCAQNRVMFRTAETVFIPALEQPLPYGCFAAADYGGLVAVLLRAMGGITASTVKGAAPAQKKVKPTDEQLSDFEAWGAYLVREGLNTPAELETIKKDFTRMRNRVEDAKNHRAKQERRQTHSQTMGVKTGKAAQRAAAKKNFARAL